VCLHVLVFSGFYVFASVSLSFAIILYVFICVHLFTISFYTFSFVNIYSRFLSINVFLFLVVSFALMGFITLCFSYGNFFLLIVHRIGWSFGIIIKAFKNSLRAFQSHRGLNHTSHVGCPNPIVTTFHHLWL
jgi:hypothetical protein